MSTIIVNRIQPLSGDNVTVLGNVAASGYDVSAVSSDSQILINSGGSLTGTSAFNYDSGTDTMSVGGTVIANYFVGDGSGLTNVPSVSTPYSAYVALLTQLPPTTITAGTLFVGAVYTIDNYASGDDFSNVAEVLSGTINETGCVFRAVFDSPATYVYGSELSYSGDPVSTVLQNDFGGSIDWSYVGTGVYCASSTATTFTAEKTYLSITQDNNSSNGIKYIYNDNAGLIYINTLDDTSALADGELMGTSIEIRVYN